MIEQAFNWTWGWIIAGVIVAGLEILIPGIYLMWIGLGAFVVGLILTLLPGLPLGWQMLVFAVSMLSSVGFGFWIQRRSGRTPHAMFLNEEMKAMVGHTYIAIAPFAVGRGRIKVQDSSYAAISDEEILAGDAVEVIAIEDGWPKVVKAPMESGLRGNER